MSYGKLFSEYKKATDDVLQWLRSLSGAPRSLGLNAHLKLAKEAAGRGTPMPPNIADDLRIAISRRQQTAKIHQAEDGVACSGHDNVIRVLEHIQHAFFPVYECESQQIPPVQYPPPPHYIPMAALVQQTLPQESLFGTGYQTPHLAVPAPDLTERSAQPFSSNGYECESYTNQWLQYHGFAPPQPYQYASQVLPPRAPSSSTLSTDAVSSYYQDFPPTEPR